MSAAPPAEVVFHRQAAYPGNPKSFELFPAGKLWRLLWRAPLAIDVDQVLSATSAVAQPVWRSLGTTCGGAPNGSGVTLGVPTKTPRVLDGPCFHD